MLYDKKWDEQLPTNTDHFKTAAELGLRDLEYNALLRLLPMFKQGKIPDHLFNMRYIGHPECASPGCIIGWARAITKSDIFGIGWSTPRQTPEDDYEITELLSSAWATATPADAAIALRNYLTTGKARWAEVLKHR